MPNWCYTNIYIHHEDENALKELESKIKDWTNSNYMETGFGNSWLGNIVIGSGIGTIDTGEETDIRCRGLLTYMEQYGNTLQIDTETAWAPMMKMWDKIINKYLPDAEIIYIAEECGEGLYWTNDPCYMDKYYIDAYDMEDIETGYDVSREETIKILQQLLESEDDSIDDLINKFYDSNYIDKMSIHEWEYVEINELD